MKRAGTALAVAGAVLALRMIRRERARWDFADRTVLITGGSRGLGLLVARELARERARVAIAARIAATLHGVFPGLTAELLGLVNRLLPGSRGPGRPSAVAAGAVKGEASTSSLSPSLLTTLGDRAAERANQTP